MRIGVLSDSHGSTGRISTLLMMMEADGPLDAIIHLGDGYHDLSDLGVPLPPVYQVAGNCDFFRSDTRLTVNFSQTLLLLTHGHLQHVKQGRDQLFALAREARVHAILYGHTHVQKMEWREGILLLNPGAAFDRRCAVLTISRPGVIDVKLYGDE